jgi:hypothetical protein
MSYELLKFPFHLILHPFDGFWDMKYEAKGRLKIAFLILFVFVVVEIVQQEFAGFLVNFNDPRYINSLDQFKYVFAPFFLYCVANWSLSTLMDGEGKFTEIMMSVGYSVLPLILLYIPAIIMSNFITAQEIAFYYLINGAAMIWFIYLMFVGMMTIHQYSIGKTFITMLLTFVGMLMIIFLGMLIFSLVQQITTFFTTIYREILFWS